MNALKSSLRTRLGFEELEPRDVPAASVFDVHAATLYQLAFRRDASGDGIAFWGNQVATGNRAAVVESFLRTDEGYSVQVHDFYRTTLFRLPGPNDRSFWVGRLQAGATLDQIQSEILGSGEAFATVGNNANNFLSVVYQRTLGRALDSAGGAYWNGLLNQGTSRTEVARLILDTPEGRAYTVNSQISEAYRDILGREVDAGGRSFWSSRPNAVTNSYQLLAGVLGSQEYLSGIQSYIQTIPQGVNMNDANAVAAAFITDRNRSTTNPLDLRDYASLGTGTDPVTLQYNNNVVIASVRGVYFGRYVANVVVGQDNPVAMQTRVTINVTNVVSQTAGNVVNATPANPFNYLLQGTVTVAVAGQAETINFPLDNSALNRSVQVTQYPRNTDVVPPRGGLGVATNISQPGGGLQGSFGFSASVLTTDSIFYGFEQIYRSNETLTPSIRLQR